MIWKAYVFWKYYLNTHTSARIFWNTGSKHSENISRGDWVDPLPTFWGACLPPPLSKTILPTCKILNLVKQIKFLKLCIGKMISFSFGDYWYASFPCWKISAENILERFVRYRVCNVIRNSIWCIRVAFLLSL